MSLKDFTKEELEEEIEDREKKIRETTPELIAEGEEKLDPLRLAGKNYIDQIRGTEFSDPEDERRIFELGMAAIYGKDVLIWIDGQTLNRA